ncbi:hypothetical protein DMN91_006995 [Ooceraea biroi]|uniref:Uncharacterized protein n=1 Tax=Ooceraea biroi TaxID=2015173 RepID=A0A3L8DJ70_OOCBI|nr:hypothetical protein DMN91_006995 [Ooceraea biroi]
MSILLWRQRWASQLRAEIALSLSTSTSVHPSPVTPVTLQLGSHSQTLAGVRKSVEEEQGVKLGGGNFARPSSGRKAMDDDTPLPFYFIHKTVNVQTFAFQSTSYSSTFFQEPDPPTSPLGIRDLLSRARRACILQVPGGAWIIGRSLRVRHGPTFAYDVHREDKGDGEERGERRERGSTRISMLSHDRAREGASSGLGRGLIYEWDQTLEEVDRADWPSPTPL